MAARVGMGELIQRVRDLTSAGRADYAIGAVTYWSDDHIQSALDRNRVEIVDEPLRPVVTYASDGAAEYRTYESQFRSMEETTGGTAIWYLRDSTGARVGTALYTPDYELGRVVFHASVTGGSVLYLNARAYDVYAAAADIWRQKAAHVADRIDFTADGASFKASQLVAQYERQAAACERRASFGVTGVNSATMIRDDVSLWPIS